MNFPEILKMKKTQLIKLAVEKAKNFGYADFNPEFFGSINAKTNGKQVLVSFRKKINFTPLFRKPAISSVVVCFDKESPDNPSMTTSWGKGFESPKAPKGLVELIKKELGIKEISEDDFWTIKEELFRYKVEILNDSSEDWFDLNKLTGKISERSHAHLAPNPFSNDNFKEIK